MTPRLLLTGGNGRLGQELRQLIPDLIAPSSSALDITDPAAPLLAAQKWQPDLIVHAAAYTDVGRAEQDRARCWQVNVDGTRHVVRAADAVGARLVHISTDYVFSGEHGQYREQDTPGPPVNYYALTKLVAEEAARAADRHLILRTSFRPREFQYPVAFTDVYTSQDYVDIIAPMLAQAILNAERIPDEVLHIVTERKSVFDLARRRNPAVQPGSRTQVSVPLPQDVSLDTQRWQTLAAAFPLPARLQPD